MQNQQTKQKVRIEITFDGANVMMNSNVKDDMVVAFMLKMADVIFTRNLAAPQAQILEASRAPLTIQ